MSARPTLMVLGAGPFQAPGIRKAAALGARVITVDNVPHNVGHRHGHCSVECSTVDVDGVLRVARDHHIDAVCTFCSDVAVPAVAKVAAELGLPGPSPAAATRMSHKGRFRAFQRAAGLPHPRHTNPSSPQELLETLRSGALGVPLVCKPPATSGSRGVARLDSLEPAAVSAAWGYAARWAGGARVCAEEWVSGVEVGGDALLADGELAFVAITHKHLSGFVVTGHSLPNTLSPADSRRVERAIEACCVRLGYHSGPLNFDVMVAPERVVVLELSPRTGGNGIAAVISRATGVDLEEATVRHALGWPQALQPISRAPRPCGSLVFGAPRAGVLRRCADAATLRGRVPEVFHVSLRAGVGGAVETFEHNGALLGYALFDCGGEGGYDRVAGAVLDALDLEVEPCPAPPNSRRTDHRGGRRTS